MTEAVAVTNCTYDVQEDKKLTLEEKLKNTKISIVEAENDYNNIKLANNFINKCVVTDLDTDEITAKTFIKTDIAEAFHFAGKSGNDIIRDLIKEYSSMHKRYLILKERDAKKDALNIDPKYEGMYTVTLNTRTGELIVNPHIDEIANMTAENLNLISYHDCLFCYINGFYENNKKAVEDRATKIINDIMKFKNSKGVSANLKDAMTTIRTINVVHEYPFRGGFNAINVKNGVVVFNEEGNYHLENPDPVKYKFDYILPVQFKPDADSTKIITELEKYSDKHDAIIQILVQTVLQTMGYKPFKTGYLIYGPPDYAKTTILDIYRYFIGKEKCSAIALGRMSSEDKFSLAPLEGKLMNIKDELSYFKLSDTNTYKDITGSYDIWVEPKHIDAYAAYSTAVHVFATNRTPMFDGRVKDDEAFWKRWVLIPCNKTRFPRDEKYVSKNILTEENMSGLLNVILKEVSDYIKGTPLKYNSAIDDEWMNVREEWMQAGSPLYKFITENMVRGGETAIIKDELLEAVKEWCDENILYRKTKPETVNELNDTIKLCNGTIDERRYFYKKTVAEMSKKEVRRVNIDEDYFKAEEKHCYTLPWTWKIESKYQLRFRMASVKCSNY
ncbi:DUF5906 domain-containing protein [Methanosarcina mazei]|uniref:SF3 helicase domain-containing protein n=1 Tax=Methanosarcina mazei TaxID=2209 RepID=A0A0F8E2P0_METMZ|nr:DUF5906 domain-containing protein [Methanosarcina mazei]KKG34927.1 hypothetical protein DU30_00190 [Methanosarcina mazei]KKG64506.1 hypothetical protein DU67_07530 [Methanosarcina mazei]